MQATRTTCRLWQRNCFCFGEHKEINSYRYRKREKGRKYSLKETTERNVRNQIIEDRIFAYNVILKRVRVTIVAVENQ